MVDSATRASSVTLTLRADIARLLIMESKKCGGLGSGEWRKANRLPPRIELTI
jgi:hypothetical protein